MSDTRGIQTGGYRDEPGQGRWRDPHYLKSGLISLLMHGLLLLTFGAAWITMPEYGLQSGQSGVDVDLVAAPPAPSESTETPEESVTPEEMDIPEAPPTEFAIPATPTPRPEKRTPTPIDKNRLMPTNAGKVGDGSSPVPGHDQTTRRSSSGSESIAKPDYLRNPPPQYPEMALRAGQKGTVVLRVNVTAEGTVEDLEIAKSSGYPLLDQAARRAVRGWRFHPARVGSINVESLVEVPVDFRIQDKKRRSE